MAKGSFRPVWLFVAPKPYASARAIAEHRHEQACLAKGAPIQPLRQIADVLA